MSTGTPDAARRRVIALDVDYTVIRPAFHAGELFAARFLDREPEPTTAAPEEARVDVVLPHRQDRVANYYRPAVIKALNALQGDVDVFWVTSWLLGVTELRALEQALGFDEGRVRLPTIPVDPATGDPVGPGRNALVGGNQDLIRHWKTQTVRQLLEDESVEVLWLDDEVGERIWRLLAPAHERLHFLTPRDEPALMLTEGDVELVAQWATGARPTLRLGRADRDPGTS
ncbi:hypothetical protein OVN20_05295 [Microcella daejeonensis]|uniref:hypothetical protein n=1 Tax=Microcella daejeonensis TaxID=2994971 RepID=UPI002270591C|nr:hypothetical protein [Microcella daejeonensis]WAB84967.1 hypothetical protein OVN20_05295 [Microcella daejeonensis]